MRFETPHFRIEIPGGFVQTQVPEGYEFVDPARGEQIWLSIRQRDDVSARTLGADAESVLAARKTLAQERSAGRAQFDDVGLESRPGVERRALAVYEPTSQAAMWSAVAVYPSLVVIMDYMGGRDTSPARVAEQGRLVFDSLGADDFERRRMEVQARLSERVDPNRLYVYPVSRVNRPGFPGGSQNWENRENGTTEKVFARGARARRASGVRESRRSSVGVVRDHVGGDKDRLFL